MANNSNGMYQYLVLDSLAHGSKYGLEIIEYVSEKTGSNIIMKKPTLYSCLNRMEKKGLVSSSYWGESDLGGKRHYYNITSTGKASLEQLSPIFANAKFDQFEDGDDVQISKITDDAVFLTPPDSQQEETSAKEKHKPIFLQQDSIFNLVQETPKQSAQSDKQEKTNQPITNQIDFFSFQAQQPATAPQEQHSEEDKQKMEYYQSILEKSSSDDAKFLDDSERISTAPQQDTNLVEEHNDEEILAQETAEPLLNDAKLLDETERLTAEQEIQNKRLYDTSTELKKYRKRKSFSENQIEMSVVYENEADNEIQRARIEELKSSMLSARQNQFENLQVAAHEIETLSETSDNAVSTPAIEPEKVDDAVFITSPRVETSAIPFQKKILPPNIEIDVTDKNLPAPKRNSSLEPTYKDMMSKLFEQKKETPAQPAPQPMETYAYAQVESFVDYDSLKRYYQGHGIEFKEYRKSKVERIHNTYFLNFICSLGLLLLAGIGCAVLFGILSACNALNVSTNFMFYTVPLLFLVYSILTFVRDRVYVSKKAYFKYNGVINWAVFVLAVVVVVVANLIAGMQYEIMGEYLTALTVPIYALLLAFPINYYFKKIIYKRFAK